ncbi:hypothetical protein FHX41_1164 [Actinomadura hallensis]|uniref:LPXTG-motif cell wall-anchored protein n=1 Tax=Actinomadura hallensis TaxID=337895 RepID=A0A543IAD9_9ACTN|nr:hypothetical protein [Actinomadura hallensis]TQM67548.1 hypothetical protein FHX41_1164 [Actinomadura hallensis]
MKNSSRRIVASGALTLALAPAFGLAAAPAHADVDLEVVAEGITESGYYVDSKAKYYGSDGAQELLRQAQGRSVPVFVAILPAGNDAGQVLQQLPALMERKGTYAVLAGDQLRVSSNSLPDSQVKAAYRKAVQNSKGKPDLALLRFVQTLPESKYAPPKPGRPGNDGRPAPETPPAKVQQEEELTLAESQPTGPAEGAPQAAPKDDGSAMPFLLGGGLVAVAAAGAGGFLLWRRRSLTPSAAPGAPGAAAASGAPGAPGAADAPGQAPAPEAQPSAGAPGTAEASGPGESKPEPPKDA